MRVLLVVQFNDRLCEIRFACKILDPAMMQIDVTAIAGQGVNETLLIGSRATRPLPNAAAETAWRRHPGGRDLERLHVDGHHPPERIARILSACGGHKQRFLIASE